MVSPEQRLLKTGRSGEELMAAGVRITHPGRLISSAGRITKGGLAKYYEAAAPVMMPELARRPLSLLRCPSGIDGQCFFQRHRGPAFGAAVRTFKFRGKSAVHEYLYIENAEGLLSLIQMGAVEIHPWGARVDSIGYPDRVIFDLDPAPEVGFEAVVGAAQELRARLRGKGLKSFVKCTGGKGLHVTAPLEGRKDSWAQAKAFAGSVAMEMVAAAPDAYVAAMSKAKRTGRIFIDYFRNDSSATAIADYSVRARPGAPVAVPLPWKELAGLKRAPRFTIRDVLRRLRT